MRRLTVFSNIKTCFTFKGASRRQGRHGRLADLSGIKNAALAVEKGRIVWVGPQSDLPPEFKKSKKDIKISEYDLSGSIVLPAFVEAHTHLIFAGQRSREFELRQQGQTYAQIAKAGGGILSTLIPTRKASQHELEVLGQARTDKFSQQGVATLEVKSGYALTSAGEEKILRAAQGLTGPRVITTYLGPHAVPKESESASAYLDDVLTDLDKINRKELACRADIFVEEGFFTAAVARRYCERVRELGLDLAVHANQLSHSGGVELAIEFGARSADHLLHLEPRHIRELSRSNVTCGLLPAADFYADLPYPRARDLLDAGARAYLATDFNPGTAPTQDLSFVGILARKQLKMKLHEVLIAYTVGAAHALGMERETGSLEIGKCADFIISDGSLEDFFYQVGALPVSATLREGKKIFGADKFDV